MKRMLFLTAFVFIASICNSDDREIIIKLNAAIKKYTEAIKVNPKDTLAFLNRGNAFTEKENFDKAIEDYSCAIQINANYADAFYNRGKSKYIRISWDEATDIIAKEIKRVKEQYGMSAVLVQADGHGETRRRPGEAPAGQGVSRPASLRARPRGLVAAGRRLFADRAPRAGPLLGRPAALRGLRS